VKVAKSEELEAALARAVISSVEIGTDGAAAKFKSSIDPQLPAPRLYAKQP
jgi:hypothetical protein